MKLTIGEIFALLSGHGYVCATVWLTRDSYVQKYSGRSVLTLFKFDEAVSPHVAARGADLIVRFFCVFW
jgi:hypothetical protein